MNFIPNIHFTVLIRVNGRLMEFNFRRRTPDLYDGDTSDERGFRILFHLIKGDDKWKLRETDLPGWLMTSEAAISDAIISNDPH